MKSTDDILKDDHFKLLAFLITSVRGGVGEPSLYGPLRLVDVAVARIIKKISVVLCLFFNSIVMVNERLRWFNCQWA
ncbi:hypothetical protein DRO69_06510 [Candidatus Bathyarchaeota archaeon]|nr:MAG: hypothetical protein DRO69_06510 [Candidatus Bathyarchaeota archaeon]